MSDVCATPATPLLRPSPGLWAALEEGVVMLDDAGRVTAANPAFVRLAGAPVELLLGQPLLGRLRDPVGAALDTLAPADALRLRDETGRLRPIALRSAGDGVWVVCDRERESRLERELWREAGSEPLASLGVPQGAAAAMVEHEMRTATTVARGYLRMLQDGRIPTGEEASGLLGLGLAELDRVEDLLDDLLLLAHGEGDDPLLRVSQKPVALGPVLEAAVRSLAPVFERRSLRLRIESDRNVQDGVEPDPAAAIDPERIQYALRNLLLNAAGVSPEGGEITVRTQWIELSAGGEVAISVEDEGPGVSTTEAERIFEPFARGAVATSGTGGLGLAVCRKIVEAHGGRVRAEPDVGHGHFTLVLPLDVHPTRSVDSPAGEVRRSAAAERTQERDRP